MRLRIYHCPACGYSLKVEIGSASVICPACGSTVMVEQEENGEQKSAERRTITDAVTGEIIASARIPAGWNVFGEINKTMQSLSNPFTAQVKIVSPDQNTLLFANSGETFQQVKKEPMHRHQEGSFNQSTKMPMRTFQLPGDYLDGIAQNMAMGREIKILQTGPLPSIYGCNLQGEKQKAAQEAAMLERNASMSGIQVKVQNLFAGALMKIYQMGEQVLILGADMGGSEYAMYAPGMGMGLGFGMANMFSMGHDQVNVSEDEYKGFLGFIKGGGLVGAMARKKARERNMQTVGNGNPYMGGENTKNRETSEEAAVFGKAPVPGALYAYADWGSRTIYGLITNAPLEANIQKIFDRFVRTFQFDPSIPAKMKAMAEEITRQNVTQQQQWFAAQQQAHRTVQDAFDRQNQAWWDRQNQTYEHQRSAWQNRMDAEDRMSEKWAEATRGENTYVRPDGSETTFSNNADRVFMKDGDPQTMRGASKGEDVPYGWTELKKKW